MKIYFSLILGITILIVITACIIDKKDGKNSGSGNSDWELAWSDEFNYTGLPDSMKWGYDVGGNGWGNHEEQYYTNANLKNARVENGNLIIEARKEQSGKNNYTSARLVTKGKEAWLYGRFEVRAKLPAGRGTWPAIWLLSADKNYGTGYWPDNGEIDIMEHVGFNPGYIHASTHSKKYYWRIGTQRTDTIYVPDFSTHFHTYAMEWYPDKIKIFVDDSCYFTSLNDNTGWEAWPFDKPFYILLNIAIGGDWGGLQGVDTTIWPQQMVIDYVRVYKLTLQ